MKKSFSLRSLSALFTLLLAGVFTLSLTACGDDDDKKNDPTPTGNYMKIDGKVKNIRWSGIHWVDMKSGKALEMLLSDEKIDLATQEQTTDYYLIEDDAVLINVHSHFLNQNMDLTKAYTYDGWFLGIGIQGVMYWPDENDFKNGTLTVNQLSDTKFKVTGKGTTKLGNTFEL